MSQPLPDKSRWAKTGSLTSTPVSLTTKQDKAAVTAPPPESGRVTADNTVATTAADTDMLSRIFAKLETINDDVKDLKSTVTNLKEELSSVQQGMSEIKVTTSDMGNRLESELKDIKGVLASTKDELHVNKRKLAVTEQMLAASRSALNSLARRFTQMENKERLRNIIIDGMHETDGEDMRKIVLDIADRICPGKVTQESFNAIYRLGKKVLPNGRTNNKKTRSIMVIFKDVRTRNEFYFARTKLKAMDQLRGIYLNDDVTPETKRARDDYRSVATIARNAGALVRVHDDGLVLDGTKYRLFEPETLPKEFSLAKAKTMETTNGVFFHSENSFLSNFFPSPIWADGHAFPTAEHRYQSQKCKMSGDENAMHRVMAAPTPLEAKRIADAIMETAEWRSKREEVMNRTIEEKFDQNRELAKQLLQTGKMKLFEATSNNFFGIGATLHSREVRDMSFKGLNKLGTILQAKRDTLSTTNN